MLRFNKLYWRPRIELPQKSISISESFILACKLAGAFLRQFAAFDISLEVEELHLSIVSRIVTQIDEPHPTDMVYWNYVD